MGGLEGFIERTHVHFQIGHVDFQVLVKALVFLVHVRLTGAAAESGLRFFLDFTDALQLLEQFRHGCLGVWPLRHHPH